MTTPLPNSKTDDKMGKLKKLLRDSYGMSKDMRTKKLCAKENLGIKLQTEFLVIKKTKPRLKRK